MHIVKIGAIEPGLNQAQSECNQAQFGCLGLVIQISQVAGAAGPEHVPQALISTLM